MVLDASAGDRTRVALVLYALVSPPFVLSTYLLASSEMSRVVAAIAVATVCTAAALIVALRKAPKPTDWIFPIAIAPIVCCGIAFAASGRAGPGFIVVVGAPVTWAALLFELPVVVAAVSTAVVTCFGVTANQAGFGAAFSNALLVAVSQSLVAWATYGKSAKHRALTLALGATIEDRIHAESRLRGSEQRFERLFRHDPALMALTGVSDGQFVDVNDAWLRSIGYVRSEVVGRTSAELGLFPDVQAHSTAVATIRRTGVIKDVELEVRCKDGRILLGLFSAEVVNGPGQEQVLTVMLDITEHKRAEAQLLQTSDRLSLALRAGSIGIWDWDVVDNKMVWDDQMFSLYGSSRDTFGGAYEAWRVGLHVDDVLRAHDEVQQALRGERSFDTEFRVVWSDGSVHDIRALGLVQRDAEGRAIRMLGTNWDITASKSAEAKLCEANRQLREATVRANELAARANLASTAKSAFLANMSHEIRTPMNGVIGMLELLRGTELSTEQRQYAEVARSSGSVLLSLISDILDISKIEAGKMELEQAPFDLLGMLTEVAAATTIMAAAKGLQFRVDIDPVVPAAYIGDVGRLRQVVNNLLSNAVKFTSVGGVVLVLRLNGHSDQHVTLRFTVQDTGIGIDESRQSLLFQKFHQVDASTTRRFGGTGLGLAISRELVEIMGGHIGVRSGRASGSEFWFTVRLLLGANQFGLSHPSPRAAANAPLGAGQVATESTEIVPSTAKASNASPLVLIVEDNPTNQMVAEGLLRRLGVRAAVVDSGRAAIDALTHGRYSVVLMDIQMPDMDGIMATQMIRSGAAGVLDQDVPVFAMTAHVMPEERLRCLMAGMNGHIAKPISASKLTDVLVALQILPTPEHALASEGAQNQRVGLPDALDYSGLLARLTGDRDLVRRLLQTFMDDLNPRLQALARAVEANDAVTCLHSAHSLQGAAATVGANAMREIAMDIEEAAKRQDLAAARVRLPSLLSECDAARDSIARYLGFGGGHGS